jgi:WD40 repeat protein
MVNNLAFSADGSRIISGGDPSSGGHPSERDRTVRLWDAETGQPIGEPIYGLVRCVALSPDGTRIVSGDEDGRLRLSDANGGQSNGTALASSYDVAFGATGLVMAYCRPDGEFQLRDLQNGELIRAPHEGLVKYDYRLVALSPDGLRIVLHHNDKTWRLWDINTGKQIGAPIGSEPGWIDKVAFSPDSLRFVSLERVGDHGMLRLWDANTGEQIGKQIEYKDSTFAVAFSPDGTRIVWGGPDNEMMRLWDANNFEQIGAPLTGHRGAVFCAAFSPDGSCIVSGGHDKTIRLWDANTSEQIGAPLTGHDGVIFSVAFSRDGMYIVSGGADGLRLWNAKSGRSIGALPPETTQGRVEVLFNNDDSRLVFSSDLGIGSWPGPKTWAGLLCSKLTRNMTRKQWQEWVSPQIDYQVQCPGLPVPE